MTPSVFRTLLGNDLDTLGGALRRFSDHPSRATGVLTVTHHPGRMARFFIFLLRLPAEGQEQAATIQVSSSPNTEVWSRVIGKSRLKTRHRAVGPYLEECVWPFRFLHKVDAANGALFYHQAEVYLLGLRLPHLFSPIINARAEGDEKGWVLDLTVSCPRCGPICSYQGWIEVS